MSRVLNRPMFKMGGSTGSGITSGLKRQGYDAGKMVRKEALEYYDAMKDNDFVNLFNTLINKIRLMSNLSTNNVEHKHNGGVQLVMPKE